MTDTGRDQHAAAGPRRVAVALLTISDTRTADTDTSGDYLAAELERAGHLLVRRAIVRDDREAILEAFRTFLAGEAQVIISSPAKRR